jgi:hypothetical protein
MRPVQTVARRFRPGSMFISEVGLRSGWAQAIWAVIYSALTLGAQFSFAAVPSLRAWAAAQPHGVVTVPLTIVIYLKPPLKEDE